MSSPIRSDKMHTTGGVLSWLAGLSVLGTLIICLGFVGANAVVGTDRGGTLARLIGSVATALSVVVLLTEAGAVVLLLTGLACWRSRIFRSPRWVLSAVGVLLVAAAILMVAYFATVIAISSV